MGRSYQVDCDPERLDRALIHRVLEASYWAQGITRETMERSLLHSINFGCYLGQEQVGFARCISDRATYAYLADVFVLEEHRCQGLGKQLVRAALEHPDLQGLRRWMLATKDAHTLYHPFGFQGIQDPELLMKLRPPTPNASQ